MSNAAGTFNGLKRQKMRILRCPHALTRIQLISTQISIKCSALFTLINETRKTSRVHLQLGRAKKFN